MFCFCSFSSLNFVFASVVRCDFVIFTKVINWVVKLVNPFMSSVDKDAIDKATVLKVSSHEVNCFKFFSIFCSEVRFMLNSQKVPWRTKVHS